MLKVGIEQWREQLWYNNKSLDMWRKSTIGNVKQQVDIHGNNLNFRSSKARLCTAATELEDLATMEKVWEALNGLQYEDDKAARVLCSATEAVARYTAAIDQEILREIAKSSAIFGRKRGREREYAADPGYPESDEDDKCDPDRHTMFECNETQSDLIEAIMRADNEENIVHPPKRERRRENAEVSLHDQAYVRDEADVDVLRHQVLSSDSTTLHGASLPALKPPRHA